MVKIRIEHSLRLKSIEARNGNFDTSAVVKNHRMKQIEQRSLGDCWQLKANWQFSVSDTIKISVQNRHSRTFLQDLLRSRMWKLHREPSVLEAEAQVAKWLDCRARITSKDFAQLHSVKIGILRSACSTRQKMDADLEKSALTHTDSSARSLKRMVTKLQWLYWRIHDKWVAYFKIWSRRSLQRFCGRAQTYWSQSDVFNSPKPCYVTPTFETKNHRLE